MGQREQGTVPGAVFGTRTQKVGPTIVRNMATFGISGCGIFGKTCVFGTSVAHISFVNKKTGDTFHLRLSQIDFVNLLGHSQMLFFAAAGTAASPTATASPGYDNYHRYPLVTRLGITLATLALMWVTVPQLLALQVQSAGTTATTMGPADPLSDLDPVGPSWPAGLVLPHHPTATPTKTTHTLQGPVQPSANPTTTTPTFSPAYNPTSSVACAAGRNGPQCEYR